MFNENFTVVSAVEMGPCQKGAKKQIKTSGTWTLFWTSTVEQGWKTWTWAPPSVNHHGSQRAFSEPGDTGALPEPPPSQGCHLQLQWGLPGTLKIWHLAVPHAQSGQTSQIWHIPTNPHWQTSFEAVLANRKSGFSWLFLFPSLLPAHLPPSGQLHKVFSDFEEIGVF